MLGGGGGATSKDHGPGFGVSRGSFGPFGEFEKRLWLERGAHFRKTRLLWSLDEDSMCITSWLHNRREVWCDLLARQRDVILFNFVRFENSLFFLCFYSIFNCELCVKMELMRTADRDKSTYAGT